MRIERISDSQFTIFLTFDDLIERGFTKEDLWQDVSNVHDLFSDMMHEASFELGFELEGMLFVQVHLMQAQGMHIVVTQNEESYDDDYIEMKVTLDESDELIFSFNDFEEIIQLASCLITTNFDGGRVFYYNDRYYMLIDDKELLGHNKENIIAIMSEFAVPSIVTSYRLLEYGKEIYATDAVKQIIKIFYKNE